MRIRTILRNLACDKRGYGTIEYALIAVFAAFGAIVFMPKVLNSICVIFTKLEALMGGATHVATPTLPVDVVRIIFVVLAMGLLSLILHRRSQAADE